MQLYEPIAEPVIHIVDDCEAIRDSLSELLTSLGLKTATYASAHEFLDSCQFDRSGCIILDLRMPGMDGLELQQRLGELQIGMPTIFLTAHGDLPAAVLAMKRGAVDFLTKPFQEQDLLDSIKSAIARDAENRARRRRYSEAEYRLSKLTPREREVLKLLMDGKSNKLVAAELGLSYKTVEFHRSRIMAKSRSDSMADLVRMSILATELGPKTDTAPHQGCSPTLVREPSTHSRVRDRWTEPS
jgi:FixJ family two-component response regulator